jgi:hypothetical protein
MLLTPSLWWPRIDGWHSGEPSPFSNPGSLSCPGAAFCRNGCWDIARKNGNGCIRGSQCDRCHLHPRSKPNQKARNAFAKVNPQASRAARHAARAAVHVARSSGSEHVPAEAPCEVPQREVIPEARVGKEPQVPGSWEDIRGSPASNDSTGEAPVRKGPQVPQSWEDICTSTASNDSIGESAPSSSRRKYDSSDLQALSDRQRDAVVGLPCVAVKNTFLHHVPSNGVEEQATPCRRFRSKTAPPQTLFAQEPGSPVSDDESPFQSRVDFHTERELTGDEPRVDV